MADLDEVRHYLCYRCGRECVGSEYKIGYANQSNTWLERACGRCFKKAQRFTNGQRLFVRIGRTVRVFFAFMEASRG